MENIQEFYKAPEGSDLAQLKPCPFCGKNEIVYARYNTKVGDRWRIMCCDCLATIDPGYAQSRATVQAMWNNRKEPA